jgi:hypothetical protein
LQAGYGFFISSNSEYVETHNGPAISPSASSGAISHSTPGLVE